MAVGLAPSFGQLLRHHRLHVGMSQEKLAEEAGLSVNQISDLERDRRARPHPDTLKRLADALGLTERERDTFVALARPGRTGQLAPTRPRLPLPLTRFFARPEDVAAVRQRLSHARLLTLTGAGGVGKTRLALEIAHAVGEEYRDGVWLVELAGLQEGSFVPQAVGRTLGLPEQAARPADEVLQATLRDRHVLLIMDNCEHLLDACAHLIDGLLRYCPEVRVLATSREMLRLDGEYVWPVQPLAVPPSRQRASAEGIGEFPAIQLFIDRASAVSPQFALTVRNAAPVAQICRQLDGIPLAIELAAARVATLPVEELAARLEDRFRLLTEGSRAAAPRHQTLRAALEWGDGLLAEAERALLWRLSVFAGGWTMAAAERVVGGEGIPADEVAPLLLRLAAKSLVQVEQPESGMRYRLLEPIRQYADEFLLASGEMATWQRRHAGYFLTLAEESAPALRTEAKGNWLTQLEVEQDNLRTALRWLIARGDSVSAVRLAAALGKFWQVRCYFWEGRQWLVEALALRPVAPDDVRAMALEQLGELAHNLGDYVPARAALEESRGIFERLGDRRSLANVIRTLASITLHETPPDLARSTALIEESQALLRALDHQHGIALGLFDLGNVAIEQGEYVLARQYFEEALRRERDLGMERLVTVALVNLGLVGFLDGKDAQARTHLAEMLGRVVLPEDSVLVAYALAVEAGLASRVGRPEQAARLSGASEGICAIMNYAMPTEHRARFDRHAAAAREQLDPAAWTAAWAAGFTLKAEEALLLAQGEV